MRQSDTTANDPGLILEEIKLVQDTHYKIWSLYLHWFSWFYGATLLVFGWLFTEKDTIPAQGNPIFKYVIFTWLLATFLGIFASLLVVRTSASSHKRIHSMISEMPQTTLSAIIRTDLILPRTLLVYAGCANAVALFFSSIVWIMILLAKLPLS